MLHHSIQPEFSKVQHVCRAKVPIVRLYDLKGYVFLYCLAALQISNNFDFTFVFLLLYIGSYLVISVTRIHWCVYSDWYMLAGSIF